MNMECLLCGKPCLVDNSIDNITVERWRNIQLAAEKWKGLDKFGTVWESTNWDSDGHKGLFMHPNCNLTLFSSRKLSQAAKRKEKADKVIEQSLVSTYQQPGSSISTETVPSSPPSKRTRSSIGVIYQKDHCVWCSKKPDKKHPNRKGNKLHKIETFSRWREFKRHVPFLEDLEMKRRINCLIYYTVDAPADDISYHMSCWTKYVLPAIELGLQSHLQNINLDDGRQLFFRRVDEIIFQKREIRALQWLLSDYKVIIGDYGIEVNDMKSSYLKELLVKEYGDSIGFQPPIQKNKSE